MKIYRLWTIEIVIKETSLHISHTNFFRKKICYNLSRVYKTVMLRDHLIDILFYIRYEC